MRKRLLSALLSLCMILTMLPATAFAVEEDTDTTNFVAPLLNENAASDESPETQTSYVYGGCMIDFTKNNDEEDTYTATVRALTSEEAAANNVQTDNIGKLATGAKNVNQWDGNGDWQSGKGPFTPADYWAVYKDKTTKVVVKSGVTALGGAAFTRYDKVTSLEWEGTPTVKTIANNFLMCSSISELTIPESVTEVGSYAFGKYNKTGIAPTKVTLQNPAVKCGANSFAYQDCANVLIEVNTQTDITDLIAYAKKYGYQIKNLADFGEGTIENISWTYSAGILTLQGSGAIPDYTKSSETPWSAYMDKISTLNMSDGITAIGDNAFNGAAELTNFQLPKSVTSIGSTAFANSGLSGNVRIPATVTAIGTNAFENVKATIYIYNGIWNNDGESNLIDDTKIGAENVVHYIYGANIGGSTYPRTTNVLLGIEADGTAYVDGYSSGTVSGFNYDGGYHYIEVAPDNDESKTEDKSVVSPLFWKNTSIWPHSADVNPLVKKVVIGDNVISMHSGLFAYCTNLTELKVTGKNLTTLGNNVFMGTSIKNVDLPATVSYIGSYCFGQYNNKGVNPTMITLNRDKNISFNGKTTDFAQDLIFCSSKPQAPQKITLRAHGTTNAKAYAEYAGYTFVNLDAAGGQIGTSNTYWTMKDDHTLMVYGQDSTGDFTAETSKPWSSISGITAIEVAPGVTNIGAYLFSGMTDVSEVTVSSGVESIGDYAFYDLSKLQSAALPSTVASVGEYAFALATASSNFFTLGIGNSAATVAETATENRNATTDQPIASGNCGKGNSGSYQNNITYALSLDGTMTLSGSGEMGNFAWNGQNQPWREVRDQIKKVVYSEGITSTGSGAFAYCSNLTAVTLPQKSMKTISNNTFMDAGTEEFDNFTIPATVTKIDSYAFGYYQKNRAAKITRITLNNPETTFAKEAFNGNSSIENSTVTVYVHNNGADCTVKTKSGEYGYKFIDLDTYFEGEDADCNLKYDLYDGVLTLTTIDLEQEATIPTTQPWEDKNTTVTKLVIGTGIKNIPDNAFKDYTALAAIELPRTLRTIGANAFATTDANNAELSVTIPKAVTSIAENTFAGRSNVKIASYAETAGGKFNATGVTNTAKKEFKVLLIGNSYSEDASDWTTSGAVSHSYEIYKSIMGDDVDLEIGLMASGGKVLAWHATNAADDKPQYTLRLTDSDGKWTYVSTVKTIKAALSYDDWDVVSLQPYGQETSTGVAGNNQGDYTFDADRFGTLDKSIPYFLDLTEVLAPQAKVYYYMHLSEHGTSNYADALKVTASTYANRVKMTQAVKEYHGKTYDNKTLTDVIPVGTAVQNARTTYLTKLSNADTSVPVALANDPVFGLQRDGGHLTYNVGRYIAALTFAEKIIPNAFRNDKTDCGMRASQAVGILPEQYAEIARKAVANAINNPYAVTTLDGYENDPIESVKIAAKLGNYAESAWSTEDAFKAAVEVNVGNIPNAKIDSVTISDGKATVVLRYGYSTATAEITYTPDAVVSSWTTYISSTKLGDTAVPGSDMKYSEVPAIQTALAKGYSDIWAAASQEDADKALAASKANLLSVVKEYVKYLADTVYNGGKPTELNGKTYSVSEADYKTAVSGITDASEISDVLSAYDTMLSKQTTKTITAILITPDKIDLTGGGTVELTVSGVPSEGKLAVTCDNNIKVSEKDGKYTAELPNKTQKYTFTASYTGTDVYTDASDTCVVNVTRKSSSSHSSSSSSTTTNTVSASKANNGSVSLDKSSAKKGDTVTITVKSDKGYKLDKLTVTDSKGNTITVTNKGNGKYSFTMPDGKVTVTPTFVAEQTSTEQPSDTKSFSDVSSSDWFNDAVKYVVDKGMMNGVGNNKFAPNDSTTRGMLMTVIARYAGQDTTGSNPWYQKGMEWAKSAGVSDGTAPNTNITREQLVTMLYRYAKSAGKDVSIGEDTNILSYADATTVSEYAIPAMQWACGAGIVNGSNGKLLPKNNATRAEVAAILMRFCENVK